MKIQRYPDTHSNLKAWNAADEYLVQYANQHFNKGKSVAIYNDSFGYLTAYLSDFNPQTAALHHSQKTAIQINKPGFSQFFYLDNNPPTYDYVVGKIPKSIELFELFLQHISKTAHPKVEVCFGFMTKYFTPKWVQLCEEYFTECKQSLAQKKSRLIQCKGLKCDKTVAFNPSNISFGHKTFLQWPGVFSSSKIDLASQFLMENIPGSLQVHSALDIGCGGGVLTWKVKSIYPNAAVHATDDNYLAVKSCKLNCPSCTAHWNHSLEEFDDGKFELIVCNPPFHREYENTIEIAFSLFEQAKRVLAKEGLFMVVANTHLGYQNFLGKLFKKVDCKEKGKYRLYFCEN